ncbi:MAG: toluene tolerance protein [Micavibrio sp.]|nr:toluene tolerance protein [Micavibrio sp.]|tara:strand:- start:1826 stop:2479 length:654 start_codon:yes stop_codon:yes gene_type:complete
MKSKVLLSAAATVLVALPAAGASAFEAMSLKSNDITYQGHLLVSQQEVDSAKDFIDSMAKQGIDFLANPDLTLEQRKREFKKLLQSSFDIKTIGRFTMGRYWGSASEEQKKEFQKLFETMVIDVYSRRFSDYNGQEFEIKSARPEGRADVIVQSYIVDDNDQKISVDWRVRKKNGSYKVIDIIVEGVSMATTQRSEFASIIQRGGGQVDVLIAHLKS